MGFSFVHMADIHLDTPFKSRNAELRNQLRDSTRNAFKSGVDFAIGHGADALLIAGDMFDNDTLSFSTENFLAGQFNRLLDAKIKVFYAPGNHDPSGTSFRLNSIEWPSNVHIFKSSRPEIVPLYGKDGNIVSYIAGAGHETRKEGADIAARFPIASGNVPYIGLLHALVTGIKEGEPHERYAPCTMEDLLSKGYSYWALGHVHTTVELCSRPGIIYPGNIIGRNPRETGPKGAYYVQIGDDGRVDAEFIELAPVTWQVFEISALSDAVDIDKLTNKICSTLHQKLDGKTGTSNMIVRLLLEGPCPLYKELQIDENIEELEGEIGDSMGFQYLEIKANGITNQVEPENYKGQVSVLGKALGLIDMLKTDDALMEEIMPDNIAGTGPSAGKSEKLKYMRALLDGLDYETAARMLKGDRYED